MKQIFCKIFFIFFLSFSFQSQAQNNESIGNFGSIGFYFGKNNFINNTFTQDVEHTIASYKKIFKKNINLTLNYRYVFKHHFFSEAGIVLQYISDRNYVEFSENSNTGFNTSFSNGYSLTFGFPVNFGYRYKLADKLSLNSSVGFGITIIPFDDYSEFGTSDSTENPARIVIIQYNNKNPVYPDAHFQIGIGFDMGNILLEPRFIYSKSFKDYIRGTYQFYNLKDEPDFGGTFSQSGDYIGFQLGIRFKKIRK